MRACIASYHWYMTNQSCAVDGCSRPYYAKSYCRGHYDRFHAHGDVRADVPIGAKVHWPHPNRKVGYTVDPVTGCWNHDGHLDENGYPNGYYVDDSGRYRMTKRSRVAYMEANGGPGSIPVGYEIDHLCRNPACINPSHLEPVTPEENNRRRVWAERKECPNGHPVAGPGKCKPCGRDRQREYQARKKAGVA